MIINEKKQALFKNKSKACAMNSKNVYKSEAIDKLIVKNIKLVKSMYIIGFGTGSRLFYNGMARYVAKITVVDNSPAMLLAFQHKGDDTEANI